MKGRLKEIFVSCLAIITAIVILDVFCFWYYNPPAYLRDKTRATDTVRQPNVLTSRATEGFAWAVTDANGYNNASVPEGDIFVLAMGSSHMEGFNVMQDQTLTSRLEEMLDQSGKGGSVYNIGMSSHTVARNIANMDRALERFKPTGYVILETHDIAITKWELNKAKKDSFGRRKATNVPLPDFISERPLLRALYNQYMTFTGGRAVSSNPKLKESAIEAYNQSILELMQKVWDVSEKHGVTPVFVYHPHLTLCEDGSVKTKTDINCLNAFVKACEATGVVFVDMTQDFIDNYEHTKILPHGFANTTPGTGHLNKTGHELIARAVCEEIIRLEDEK